MLQLSICVAQCRWSPGLDHWLITLLNDSDVNKISHSFEKCHRAEKRGEKIQHALIWAWGEVFSAVQMNDSQSKNISVTMLQFLEQEQLCVWARCKHAGAYTQHIHYIQYMPYTCQEAVTHILSLSLPCPWFTFRMTHVQGWALNAYQFKHSVCSINLRPFKSCHTIMVQTSLLCLSFQTELRPPIRFG